MKQVWILALVLISINWTLTALPQSYKKEYTKIFSEKHRGQTKAYILDSSVTEKVDVIVKTRVPHLGELWIRDLHHFELGAKVRSLERVL